jgi:hypothetical protein
LENSWKIDGFRLPQPNNQPGSLVFYQVKAALTLGKSKRPVSPGAMDQPGVTE